MVEDDSSGKEESVQSFSVVDASAEEREAILVAIDVSSKVDLLILSIVVSSVK